MKESIVTIAAGLFLGVVAGFAMTDFLVRCVEYDNVMFVRNFDKLAWDFAIIVELLFALAINMISYRQLQKLKLTDITK